MHKKNTTVRDGNIVSLEEAALRWPSALNCTKWTKLYLNSIVNGGEHNSMKSTCTKMQYEGFWGPYFTLQYIWVFIMDSSHHFLSTAKNSMSLHTKQGPIRPNLHCPNHWCRFRFVGQEAEAFFQDPYTVGKERGDTRGGWGWRETRGGLADRRSLNHINCIFICTSSDTSMYTSIFMHTSTHHTWNVRLTGAQLTP